MYQQPQQTFEKMFSIQFEQLKEWQGKLSHACYQDLVKKVKEENDKITTDPVDAHPDHVFRGSQIDNFVANWKSKKEYDLPMTVNELITNPDYRVNLIEIVSKYVEKNPEWIDWMNDK